MIYSKNYHCIYIFLTLSLCDSWRLAFSPVLQVSPLAVPLLVSSLFLCQGAPLALPCLSLPPFLALTHLGPWVLLPRSSKGAPFTASTCQGELLAVPLFCFLWHFSFLLFLNSFFLLQMFGNRCWNFFPSEGVNRTSVIKTKLKQIGHLLLVASINSCQGIQKQIQNTSEILLIV